MGASRNFVWIVLLCFRYDKRPHFDGPNARLRHRGCDPNGLVQVSGADDVERDDLGLCHCQWAIGETKLTVLNLHQRGSGVAAKFLDGQQIATLPKHLVMGPARTFEDAALVG